MERTQPCVSIKTKERGKNSFRETSFEKFSVTFHRVLKKALHLNFAYSVNLEVPICLRHLGAKS